MTDFTLPPGEDWRSLCTHEGRLIAATNKNLYIISTINGTATRIPLTIDTAYEKEVSTGASKT